MANTIERDWITESGLRAVCLVVEYNGRKSHRCGYVGLPPEHPLHGIEYSQQADCLTQDSADNTTMGKKGAFIALTAACNSDNDGLIRRSPDILFDVHGGLTYSGGNKGYPIKSDLWWFGFDCHHAGDGDIEPDPRWSFECDPVRVRSLQYVVAECESLAAQLAEYS